MSNPPPTAERTQLRKSLKLWQIVMIGLAYLTPMTVFDTFGIVSGISQGHVPTAYLLALAGVLFTAISYGKLVRQFPTAGSAYTYAQRAINPHVGFMVGWSSLLDYLFLPMINALLAKIYLTALFPEVAPWIWVVMFVLIMTLINIKSVNLVANFNTVFVLVQLAIIVVFIGLVIHGLNNGEGTATVLSTQPFFSEHAHLSAMVAGATILCFSFLGFDAVTTLSEETRDAGRVIPRAIFLTALYGGVIFITVSYFLQSYFPTNVRFKEPDAALPEIALYVGGKLFQSIFLCATFINTLASGLASQASVSRLLYVMGRDNVLPERIFGFVHPKWRTPSINVLIVGMVALSAISFDLVTATALINFGAGGLHLRQSLGDRAFLCARRAQPQPQGAFPLPGPAIARRGHRRGALAQPGKHLAGDGADLGRTGLRLPVLPDSQLQPSAAALPGERAEPDPVRRAVNGFSGNVKEKDW